MGWPKGTPRPAGAGRKKGVPNHNTQNIRTMIEKSLTAVGGQEYLEQQARENPVAYMSLIAKIIPKELDLNVGGAMTITTINRVIIDAAVEHKNSESI